jgi:hypothetical protein
VRREEQNTLATFQSRAEVFVAVVNDPLGNILPGQLWKLAKLSQEASQIGKYAADNPLSLGRGQLRQSKLQVVARNRPQPPREMKGCPGREPADGERRISWDGSKKRDNGDSSVVLKLGSYREGWCGCEIANGSTPRRSTTA